MLGVAEIGDPLQFVGPEVREHRIHFQDDRKFGLLAHRNTCLKSVSSAVHAPSSVP
jgi:hypothetical protein